MNNFCTLFDSNYLHFGLAMYESLARHCNSFHLYVFAFDDKCYQELSKLKLPHITTISLSEFEDEELLKVKSSRSRAEYCWTCTPSTILYVLENFKVDNCTYLDADLFFYDDPSILIHEMGANSVMLTLHNFSSMYEHYVHAGIYCVQFMTFRNDDFGLLALRWWRKSCNEWCFARIEDGKYGDQKYLDDWLVRFKNIYVLKNEGGGVAPWNVQKYKVQKIGNDLYINASQKVIFYHFHNMKFEKTNQVNLGYYELSNNVVELIYIPYLRILTKYKRMYFSDFDPEKLSFMDYVKLAKRKLMRFFSKSYNLYYLKEIV